MDTRLLDEQMRDDRAGAYVMFEGCVRNHDLGRCVLRLEYDAYAPLALAEGDRILAEAQERFPVLGARCVHRTGRLEIGETAVWIGVSASHRREAFEACQYIIDEIKRRVPIWKKEHYVDGDALWVACHCVPGEAAGSDAR